MSLTSSRCEVFVVQLPVITKDTWIILLCPSVCEDITWTWERWTDRGSCPHFCVQKENKDTGVIKAEGSNEWTLAPLGVLWAPAGRRLTFHFCESQTLHAGVRWFICHRVWVLELHITHIIPLPMSITSMSMTPHLGHTVWRKLKLWDASHVEGLRIVQTKF